jgi:hypothetical protein
VLCSAASVGISGHKTAGLEFLEHLLAQSEHVTVGFGLPSLFAYQVQSVAEKWVLIDETELEEAGSTQLRASCLGQT